MRKHNPPGSASVFKFYVYMTKIYMKKSAVLSILSLANRESYYRWRNNSNIAKNLVMRSAINNRRKKGCKIFCQIILMLKKDLHLFDRIWTIYIAIGATGFPKTEKYSWSTQWWKWKLNNRKYRLFYGRNPAGVCIFSRTPYDLSFLFEYRCQEFLVTGILKQVILQRGPSGFFAKRASNFFSLFLVYLICI